jgi:hypothetical protein
MNKQLLRLISLAVAASSGYAFAQPITEKNLPKYPPPYGSFLMPGMPIFHSNAQVTEFKTLVAKHYGYTSLGDASLACRKAIRAERANASGRDPCMADPVAHRRDESPEIKKYGFKSWVDAVDACNTARRQHKDTADYCSADPFIRLRGKS